MADDLGSLTFIVPAATGERRTAQVATQHSVLKGLMRTVTGRADAGRAGRGQRQITSTAGVVPAI